MTNYKKPGMQIDHDPIAALATGACPSPISIIRFSGENSHKSLKKHLLFLKKRAQTKTNQLYFANLIDNNNDVLDSVMVVFFKHGFSYTGEESAELYLHGSSFIIQTALLLFYKSSFRPANPGEFTRRRFLNGKIDLLQAEGVHALINSQSRQQWIAATNLSDGKLGKLVNKIRTDIKQSLALLEARIDFPEEEETSNTSRSTVLEWVESVEKTINRLIRSFEDGRIASQGLRVALIGRPNVGKSTLMNLLLNSDRAIVSEVPGTTRDYIEEPCLLDGRLFRIVDTAGIRSNAEKIEAIGIKHSIKIAKESDIIIYLEEATQIPKDSRKDLIDEGYLNSNQKIIRVASKSDLYPQHHQKTSSWLHYSSVDERGFSALKSTLISTVDNHISKLTEQTFITSTRQKNALEKSMSSLTAFRSAYKSGEYDEVLAFELRACIISLGSIVGEISSDEILDVIFSSFCVGK